MAIGELVKIFFAYIIQCHVIASLFIVVANTEEDSLQTSWLSLISQNPLNYSTIYIHSFYWTFVTTSHVGVGDIITVNNNEYIFAIIVIDISTFTFLYFFGNIASLAQEIAPKIKNNFEKQFKEVITLLKNLKLESFNERIEVNILNFFLF